MATDIKTPVTWPNDGVSCIPIRIYTDPDIYAEEQQRIFRGPIWSFVGMADEISKPGD